MTNSKYISYIDACFKRGKLIRWPDNTMPLTMFVAPFRWYKAQNNEYEYYNMIEEAVNIWEKASGGKVKFQFVDKLYESQVNIEWKRVERKSLGHCQFNFDNAGRLFSAEVSIGLSDGIIHRQYQDKNEVFHTIVHELGHALGLQHSPYKNDIMYVPHQYGVTKISKRDAHTLKWLYTFPYGVSKEEIANHYKVSASDSLDKLIYKLEKGEHPGESEAQNDIVSEEHLNYEQKTLAELGRYNIAIQDIRVSKDAEEYFRKLRIDKDFRGRKKPNSY